MHRLTLILAIVLSGCVSIPKGVEMTEDERQACEAQGCSVWTEAELKDLVQRAMMQGYQQGRKSL